MTRALTIAAVLVLGGALATAWASVPDKAGNVRTCYSKKSGDLRVLKSSKSKCSRKKERTLTLNAKGRTGAQGPRGPIGPSNAFVLRPDTTAQSVTTTGKTVASLSLPAGSYAVDAMVRVISGGSTTNADCGLVVANTSVVSGNVNLGTSDRKMVPLTEVVVLPQPGVLSMFCAVTVGGFFYADEIRITAVRVGAVAVQGP